MNPAPVKFADPSSFDEAGADVEATQLYMGTPKRGQQPPARGAASDEAQLFPIDSATAQMGSQLLAAGSTMMADRLGRTWARTDALRYHFAVSNSYVQNKLRLLLFPFTHKNWMRLVISQSSDQEAFRPPRDDINAPDLYIPLMSFITWVLLSAIVLGTTQATRLGWWCALLFTAAAVQSFSPEAFGRCASQGIAVIVLEVLLLKGGFYLLSDAASPSVLVLTSWSGYKFVGACVNLLVYMFLGSSAFYVALVYNTVAAAYWMRETLRVTWQAAANSAAAGKYLRFALVLMQGLWSLLLSR